MLLYDISILASMDGIVVLEMSKHYLCNAKMFTLTLCQKHINYYNTGYTHTQYIQYTPTSHKQKGSKNPHSLFLKENCFDVKK